MVNYTEILKWVGIVFLAGFIGYFGRYLSKLVIANLRKEPKQTVKPRTVASKTPSKYEYKLEKKRLKLEKKKLKKKK